MAASEQDHPVGLGIVGWIVAVIVTILVLVPLLGLFIGRHFLESKRSVGCNESLSQIGQVMYAYSVDNGGYYPFDERGPRHSLALLYPAYVPDARIFTCPDVSKVPRQRSPSAQLPADSPLAGAQCDYGYTWHAPKDAPPNFAILADMPQNHDGGLNVLYADGHVAWQATPFCSADPRDNIFAPEPGWSPDTDSWIRQK